ncbi:hypothetical protein QBC39DRAFT_421401 [Podospora conica]|nr:hypothetical protein QBC39DRAFT_421401 [Schizothecium conicum]
MAFLVNRISKDDPSPGLGHYRHGGGHASRSTKRLETDGSRCYTELSGLVDVQKITVRLRMCLENEISMVTKNQVTVCLGPVPPGRAPLPSQERPMPISRPTPPLASIVDVVERIRSDLGGGRDAVRAGTCFITPRRPPGPSWSGYLSGPAGSGAGALQCPKEKSSMAMLSSVGFQTKVRSLTVAMMLGIVDKYPRSIGAGVENSSRRGLRRKGLVQADDGSTGRAAPSRPIEPFMTSMMDLFIQSIRRKMLAAYTLTTDKTCHHLDD